MPNPLMIAMRFAYGAANAVAHFAIVPGRRVRVGSGSKVRWFALRGVATRGRLTIGEGAIVHCRVDFDGPEGQIDIGNRTYIGTSHLVCRNRISIGDDVIISWGVTIVDHDSHALDWNLRRNDVADWMRGYKSWEGIAVAPVSVGNRVWIGFDAKILKGVAIGEGAVIGAGSTVTRDVPPYTLVAGNPARVIRELPRPL